MARPIDYDQQQFAVYAHGRALAPEALVLGGLAAR
jgi:hypothetical protein